MLRNAHGVGITPRAADRDELSGGMTMMKGMMVTSNMRGRKNKASKAGGSKTTRGRRSSFSRPPAQGNAFVQPLATGQEQRNIGVESPL